MVALPFYQPATDLRPQLLMGRAAYGEARVADREEQILLVSAADVVQQRQTGVRMDHVIVLANDVQHRAGDAAEVNAMRTYLQSATEELILPKEINAQFVK